MNFVRELTMKRLTQLIFVVAIVLAGTSRSLAEEPKPYMICLLPSYDSIVGALNFVAKATDDADVRAAIESEPLAKLTALNGLDKTKPAGALCFRENGEQKYIIFCGVKDLKSLLGSLTLAEPPKRRGDAWDIKFADGMILPVIEKGGWAFFCTDPKLRKLIPPNPLNLCDGLAKNYLVAFRVNFQNVDASDRHN
jgi:hypothetical protein